MLKYCLECWDKNKNKLKSELSSRTDLNNCEYIDLVKMVAKIIFAGVGDYNSWDYENITEIDNGDYQGTLLFLIPKKCCQPDEADYLMTYVGYGSCSGCDTLKAIRNWETGKLTERQVKDFMALCKDIVTNTIKPYNYGWRYDERFEVVKA